MSLKAFFAMVALHESNPFHMFEHEPFNLLNGFKGVLYFCLKIF